MIGQRPGPARLLYQGESPVTTIAATAAFGTFATSRGEPAMSASEGEAVVPQTSAEVLV